MLIPGFPDPPWPQLVQTERAVLEAQLAGATSELAGAQVEAKAAKEEASGLAAQLETAEKAKVRCCAKPFKSWILQSAGRQHQVASGM